MTRATRTPRVRVRHPRYDIYLPRSAQLIAIVGTAYLVYWVAVMESPDSTDLYQFAGILAGGLFLTLVATLWGNRPAARRRRDGERREWG